jgi:hypothetical protein
VVKRERSPSEILALIWIWKTVRRVEHLLPGSLGARLLEHPSRQIRVLRRLLQPAVKIIPTSVWLTTHAGTVWHTYRSRDARGEALADQHLTGSPLVPRRVEFPPIRVKVGSWPGWITVSEATERVDTLYHRLVELARRGDWEGVEYWLGRFLEGREAGWRRGLFSTDAHLKNYGISGDRIVLLDAGGLTDDWAEVERRLSFEEVVNEPHIQLGLGPVLGARPELAARFNARWKALVNREAVSERWPRSERQLESNVLARGRGAGG